MSKVKKIQMPSGTTLDLPDGFDWIGTKAEYDAAWAAGTIKSDWICMITDDTADNPSRANVSLTNLDSVGEARLAEKANVDLSNLSDTGSKMMDGQWVAKTQTLSTATAVGTYTIDLSDYLPNDNYNYEVLITSKAFSNNGNGCSIFLYTSDYPITIADGYQILDLTTNGANTQTNRFIFPIDERSIQIRITGSNCVNNCITVFCYRRIGTNY